MTDPRTTPRTRLRQAPLTALAAEYYEILFFALGSQCQLLFRAASKPAAEAWQRAASAWLENFEARYSRFRPASDISRLNAQAGGAWMETDAMTETLLQLCDHWHFVTEGAFDATSLPLTQLWDWRGAHETLPTPAEIEAARALVDWKRVERAPGRVRLPQRGMMLDFGGLGKEFAVDCLKELAVSMGLADILVDLGGDIATQGHAPEGDGWQVRLEDPHEPGGHYASFRLRGAAVATSGDYRRCFQHAGRTYGHIIDPRTGWPVANGTRVVTVIAPRCLAAGLLSTSAMVAGRTKAVELLERTAGVEGCLWCDDQFYETRGFRRSILPRARPVVAHSS